MPETGTGVCIQCGSVVHWLGRRTRVRERSRLQLQAGALPGRLGQLSLPSLRGRYINRVPAYWLGLRRGAFTRVGWQVILCDPMWQTPRSSRTSSRRGLYSDSALTLTFIYFEPVERFTNRRDVRAFRGFNNSMSKRILNQLKTI